MKNFLQPETQIQNTVFNYKLLFMTILRTSREKVDLTLDQNGLVSLITNFINEVGSGSIELKLSSLASDASSCFNVGLSKAICVQICQH